MSDFINTFFGDLFHNDNNLNVLQMCCRTFVLFFITLIIIRVAGMRSFGKKSAFDSIIAIMLGAVLSRAAVGANPFFPIVASGFALGIIHRSLAWLCVKSDAIGKIIKGKPSCLYKDGKGNYHNMLVTGISHKDIMEEVHAQLNRNTLDGIDEIFMERSGKISIIKK